MSHDTAIEPDHEAITFLLVYAEALHRQGVPAHRLEAALYELAGKLAVEAQFLSTPTSIQAAFGAQGAQQTNLIRVEPGASDLGRLTRLDEIGNAVFQGLMSPEEAITEVRTTVNARPMYRGRYTVLAYGLSSGAAARLFSEAPVDIIFATVAGLLVGLFARIASMNVDRRHLIVPVGATLSGLIASLAATQGGNAGVVVIAGVLVLLPGLSLTTAMTELGTGNLVSGTARAAGAIVTLLELAFGVVIAQQLMQLVPPVPQLLPRLPPLSAWTVWASLAPISLSFVVLFGARMRDLGWFFLACFLAHGIMVGLTPVLTPEGLPFVGAFLLTLLANSFARAARRPAVVVLMPGILLLVPGSMGLMGVTTMLSDVVAGMDQLFTMAFVAVALAAGVLVANVVVGPRRAL